MPSNPLPPEIVRAYDIRGTAPGQIDEAVAHRIGAGFGAWLVQRGAASVVVGRDARESSPSLYEATTAGLQSTGVDVRAAGLCPTPVVGWAVDQLNAGGGLVVTASHNPPEFNGFKLLAESAAPLMPDEIERVAELSAASSSTSTGRRIPCDAVGPYLEMLERRFGASTDIRAAIDPGNGAACVTGPRALLAAGAQVHAVRSTPRPADGPAADPQEPASLRTLAGVTCAMSAEVGIAWDGDGDRIGVLDHLGRRYEADWLTAVLARPLLARVRGAEVLLDMKTSSGVVDDIHARGGAPVLSRTGYSFFRRTMRERGLAFGGEASGHIMFGPEYRAGEHAPYIDDGVYAACALLAYLSQRGRSLAEEMSEVPARPISPELRLPCSDSDKFAAADAVGEWFAERYPNARVDHSDGARVALPDGWLHARASNTAPALSLRFEARTESTYRRMAEQLAEALSGIGSVGGIEQLSEPPTVGPQVIL